MHLLIDAGNTRIKFALTADENLIPVFHCDFETASNRALKELVSELQQQNIEVIWLASTLGVQKTETLRSNLAQLWPGIAVRNISNKSQGDLIQHCYTEPDKLGIDRLLAMIAVHTNHQTPALIFDIGTVITADLLKDKQHLGGWLCPGLDKLHATLSTTANIASGITGPLSKKSSTPLGNSTTSCIETGCRAAIVGFLEQAILISHQTFAEPYSIYITGGDAEQFATILSAPTLHKSNLVFEGMTYLVKQNTSDNMETA